MQWSSTQSVYIKRDNPLKSLQQTMDETSPTNVDQRKLSCDTLNIPKKSECYNSVDEFSRSNASLNEKSCPQLIITSPTTDNADSFECSPFLQVKSLFWFSTWPTKDSNIAWYIIAFYLTMQ